MTLKVGDKAPSFSLPNTEKNMVSLDDYNDKKLLVLFFPLAFTGVCTTELCSIRDDIGRYSNVDVDVVAISVDTLFTLGKYKEEQKLNFELLSDFNKETAKAYGALYEEFIFGMKGVAKRSAFVVGEGGNLEYVEVLEKATDLPDFEAILKVLG